MKHVLFCISLSLMAFGCGACGAEVKTVVRDVGAKTEQCAMPTLARLTTCYANHDKACVMSAALELIMCMATVTPPAAPTPEHPMPSSDAGAFVLPQRGYAWPEQAYSYSTPISTPISRQASLWYIAEPGPIRQCRVARWLY